MAKLGMAGESSKLVTWQNGVVEGQAMKDKAS